MLFTILWAQAALAVSGDMGVNINGGVNPIYGGTGVMDFTSPSSPTIIPPGSGLNFPVQPPLMGSDIAPGPALLDNGTGWPSPGPGTALGSPFAAAPAGIQAPASLPTVSPPTELPNPSAGPLPSAGQDPGVNLGGSASP